MWLVLLPTVQAQAWQDGPSPAVILMGNSYIYQSGGVESDVVPMLEEGLQVDAVRVSTLAAASLQFQDHLSQAVNPESQWFQTLDQRGWDYLVAQEQSQIPGLAQSDSNWQTSLAAAEGLGELVRDQGGELVLLITWGRLNGDEANPDRYPDFLTMQARLVEGYLTFADVAQGSVAPVGLAWQILYEDLADAGLNPTQELSFTELYLSDGSQPSAIGITLSAAVVYASLTGKSPIGLEGGFEDLEEAQRLRIQDAAHRAVFERALGTMPLPFVWGPERVEAEGGWVRHEAQHVTALLDTYSGPLEIGPKATVQVNGLYQGEAPAGTGRFVVQGEWEIPAIPATFAGTLAGEGSVRLMEQPSLGEVIVSAAACGDLSTLEVEGPEGPVEVVVEDCELRAGGASVVLSGGCGSTGRLGWGGVLGLGGWVLLLGRRRRA